MKHFQLDDQECARLRKLDQIQTDKERQEAFGKFTESLYVRYKLDEKRYFSIQTFPDECFGRVIVDSKRVRVKEVKKISKSDQTS